MLKQPATYSQQIAKLREHGCTVVDEASCEEILSRVGYYRLSAYLLTCRKKDGAYKPGTDIRLVYRLYEFDCKLRRLLFSVIEELEVYLRSQLSYHHSHKYGADGYMNPANYNFHHNHDDFVARRYPTPRAGFTAVPIYVTSAPIHGGCTTAFLVSYPQISRKSIMRPRGSCSQQLWQ